MRVMANSRLTVSNRALKKPALNKHPRRRLADPERWYFLLQIPGLWRVMFLVNEDASDEACADPGIRPVADGGSSVRHGIG